MKHFLPRLLVVTIILFLLVGAVTPVLAGYADLTSSPDPISESSYWDMVKHSRDDAGKLRGATAEKIKIGLAQLAAEWKPVTEVKMDSGPVIPVDNKYLLGTLQAAEPDINKIVKIFDALLAAHVEYPNQVFSTTDLNPLHEILSRSEFQWVSAVPNPINEWFQKMWERFMRWLDGFFNRGTSTSSVPVFPLISSVLLAVVLFYIFRTLINDLVGEARITMDDEEESEPLTSDAAFDKAQNLSRGGDYRSAVRYLYLSSLLLLDERNVLRYDRSKTNREYLRSVANSPELAQPLSEVIEVFDEVWYGYHSLDEDTFQHYSKRVQELKGEKQ